MIYTAFYETRLLDTVFARTQYGSCPDTSDSSSHTHTLCVHDSFNIVFLFTVNLISGFSYPQVHSFILLSVL
jgi:hypothetical protein